MRPLRRDDPGGIGTMRVLARLGAGGMATVYYGQSPGGRPAAVKVMHREFADREEYRDRFRREVDVAGRVGGAFTPAILDSGTSSPVPWVAWEYLPSLSLREAVTRFGPLPPYSVRALAAGMAEALAAVHAAGVIHLDVTPGNVLLTLDGPRLVDFGIARAVTESDVPAGSPGYMSPEQEAGAGVCPASDVYSLGATLTYAASGQRDPEAVDDAGLAELLRRCLVTDPARRLTPQQLAEAAGSDEDAALPAALEAEIVSDATPPPPPKRGYRNPLLAMGIIVLVLVLAGAGIVALGTGGAQRGTISGTLPSNSQAEPVRVLELSFEGDATITDLTFEVGSETVTEREVTLPWSTEVEIPDSQDPVPWTLKFGYEPGELAYQISVDGFETSHGTAGAQGAPADSSASGEV